MTIYVADVASYQGALRPADLAAAGFSGVNLKISHGLTQKSVHPSVLTWVSEWAALGGQFSTFHYLDGSATGAAQANYAYGRLGSLGLRAGAAHVVDCEADASETILRDYVLTMQRLLGRKIAVYSADWWWESRGWTVADLTPYLWAAPNAGYLASYPGDASGHWTAGYGGWSGLSVMQYAVSPVASINVSKSAIRDATVWAALRGVEMAWVNIPASTSLLAEINVVGPARRKDQDGTIGDAAHAAEPSDHNPDETGQVEDEWDSDNINEVHARDVDSRGPWADGWSMERIVQLIVARCKSGAEKRLRYVIFNRRIWSVASGWQQRTYTGGDTHSTHAHFSFHYGSGAAPGNPEQVTSAWGVRAAYEKEQDDVSADDVVTGLTTKIPYTIGRISARGWGDLSLIGRVDYMFESMVASGLVDVDNDGDLDVVSIPARVARIEALLMALAEAQGVPLPSFDPPATKK